MTVGADQKTDTDILRLESFSVSYGPACILHDLSISVGYGEIIGVLGPNGAGKTSLIRALTGGADWSGQLFFNGKKIKKPEDYFSEVAIAPQAAGLYPYLTARENIRLIGAMTKKTGVANHSQSIDKTLALVNLADRADDPVSIFSGGMRQRLNFAVAVANKPRLLFLDEPTAGVDIQARESLNKAMRAHTAQGAGIMLVTHEHDEAEFICDRVAILIDGKCVAFDRPVKLIDQYIPQKYEACISLRRSLTPEIENTLRMDGFDQVSPGEWRALKASDQEALAAFHKLTNEIGESAASLTIQHTTLSSLMRKLIHEGRS